ncbi:hypothetical protein GPALN_013284 [Globodera pallida]|nr:hypothetical protein GPALN_013284 [Globodera pallida]
MSLTLRHFLILVALCRRRPPRRAHLRDCILQSMAMFKLKQRLLFCCNRPSSTSSTLCSSAPKNGNAQIESEALCVNASVLPPLSNASSTTLCRPTLYANVQIKLERFSAPSYSPSVRFGCCDLFSLLKRMFCCSMGHDDRTAESSRSEL